MPNQYTVRRDAAKSATKSKTPAKKAATKKVAVKKTARPKPNARLYCRTCKTKTVDVSSQIINRIREGKRVRMVNCRCVNGDEFQSMHPDALKGSRLADREQVSTIRLVNGEPETPFGGFALQRKREKEDRKSGTPTSGIGNDNAIVSTSNDEDEDEIDDSRNLYDVEEREDDEDEDDEG
jgi:hypothetical protein